jgi:4-hydroxy-3-polyprenylbenzoate decarboxylase
MPSKNLRAFIELLEKQQQLLRIQTPVSAELEITEITDRVSKLPAAQNKALLFERVTGQAGELLRNMESPS